MSKDVLVRGFNEKTYSEMSNIASKKGVSITSFIKNVIDQKLKEQDAVQRKHDIILYDDEASMEFMIKSLDRLTQDTDLFRVFCAPDKSNMSKIFTKLKWFNGTTLPYEKDLNKLSKYLNSIIVKITKKTDDRLVCMMDCILEDVAKTSLKKALSLENEYNKSRLEGLMFCTYKTDLILKDGIKEMMELFSCHDQVFILKDNEIFKMHVTKENTQKLLLD
ncbi:MAG: hypothetical protein GKS07_07495 [Nitrosopumilus sp.]|nr:MAG: hypothetical protein GKS07_07495 [Nitrosopumilus sp.]